MAVHNAPQGSSQQALGIHEADTSDTKALYWNLSGVSAAWTITAVVAKYHVRHVPDVGASPFVATVTDPYGNATSGGIAEGEGEIVSITWPAGGRDWVTANAGSVNASPGNVTLAGAGGGFWTGTLMAAATPSELEITYTVGSATGSVTLNLTNACTGAALAGALLSLAKGALSGSGTTDGSGQVTVSGLDPGTWDYTVTLAGYTSASGSVPVAAGGTTTLTLSLTPTGGCAPTEPSLFSALITVTDT